MEDGERTILAAIGELHKEVNTKSASTDLRIDGLVESVNEVAISMNGLEIILDVVKKDVNGHLKDHKESAKSVSQGIFTTVLTLVGVLLAAWVVYEMGWK